MRWQMKSLAVMASMSVLYLFVADPALADLVWRNGRWVDEYSYRPTRDPLLQLSFLRLGLVAGATALGFVVGWFFSPEGRPSRLVIAAVIGLVGIGVVFFDQSALGWSAAMVMAVIGFFGGLGYWMGRGVKSFFETPTTFGSSKWATVEHMDEQNLLNSKKGLLLGTVYDGVEWNKVTYDGDRHIFTYAPTRSGKGVSHIIPNLLTYQGSMVVIDPKAENAMITAEARRKMGQTVYCVDPWGISGEEVARFNPLDWIDLGDVDATENAMLLADALVQKDAQGERFFEQL